MLIRVGENLSSSSLTGSHDHSNNHNSSIRSYEDTTQSSRDLLIVEK